MKKFAILLMMVVALQSAFAQVEPNAQDKYYNAQYSKLYKSYVKKPNNVVILLSMAQFYSDVKNPMLNLPLAMKYITSAEENYVAIIEDDKRYSEAKEAIKKGITITSVRQQKQYIVMQARQYVKEHTNITNVELDNYAQAFASDPGTVKIIEAQRMHSNFNTARKTNTIEAYLRFINAYPGTAEAEEAANIITQQAASMFTTASTEEEVDRRLEQYKGVDAVKRAAVKQKAHIAFLAAEKKNDIMSYRNYMVLYPSGDDYALALDRMNKLLEQQYENMDSAEDLAEFVKDNSENPLAEQAMDRLRKMITEKQDTKALEVYLKNFPLDQYHTDIYRLYYEWCSAEGDLQPIRDFEKKNPDFPFKQAIVQDLKLDTLLNKVDLTARFDESKFQNYVSYIRKLTGKGIAFTALQRMIQQQVAAQRWNDVNERLEYVMLSFDEYDVARYQELKSIVNANSDVRRKLTSEVAPSYNIIHPVLHPNGEHLYFTKELSGNRTIHYAESSKGRSYKWKSVGDIVFTNIENKNLRMYCFFDDGQKMLIGKDGDILMAEKDGSSWIVREDYTEGVNTSSIETDAFMLPDGSGMLFASDRPYGHNFNRSGTLYHGDTAMALDIYYIPRTDAGWGEAVNLGTTINSGFCDRSPVLSRDMKALYFVTDARGLGYTDVYMATREDVNDWTGWSAPTNLGKDVNSGFREESVTISSDDKTLFVSSNRIGRYAVYSLATQHSEGAALRNVMIDGSELKSLLKTLGVADLSAQSKLRLVDVSKSASELMKLYSDHEYAVFAETEDYWAPAERFDPQRVSLVKPQAYSAVQLTEMSEVVDMEMCLVTFEEGSDQLTQAASEELARLGRFLMANQQVKAVMTVCVEGDNVEDCYQSSLSRARSIKKTILDAGASQYQVSVSPFGNNLEEGRRNGVWISIINK